MSELEKLSEMRYVPPSSMAVAYMSMGDRSRVIELLERAVEEHDTQLFFIVVSYFGDPLRDDLRFQEILRKMNLPAG